jgi:hypothetical protein
MLIFKNSCLLKHLFLGRWATVDGDDDVPIYVFYVSIIVVL